MIGGAALSNLARVYSITADDYLAGEALSPIRHEYVAGEVFAMAGATEEHATIAGNLFALLRAQVRGGPCRVYIADMKLRVEAPGAGGSGWATGTDWYRLPLRGRCPLRGRGIPDPRQSFRRMISGRQRT